GVGALAGVDDADERHVAAVVDTGVEAGSEDAGAVGRPGDARRLDGRQLAGAAVEAVHAGRGQVGRGGEGGGGGGGLAGVADRVGAERPAAGPGEGAAAGGGGAGQAKRAERLAAVVVGQEHGLAQVVGGVGLALVAGEDDVPLVVDAAGLKVPGERAVGG